MSTQEQDVPEENTQWGPESIQLLPITGIIEGHRIAPPNNKTTKYEQVVPALTSMEINPRVKGILVTLNTPGGDVEAGLAIAEMIAGVTKPTVSLVVGGGHSIGLPIAVAAEKSFIAPSASIVVHPIREFGVMVSVPDMGAELSRSQDRIITFVAKHSNVEEKDFKALMYAREDMIGDIGTVLDAGDAVQRGLIDSVGGIGDAVKALRGMMG